MTGRDANDGGACLLTYFTGEMERTCSSDDGSRAARRTKCRRQKKADCYGVKPFSLQRPQLWVGSQTIGGETKSRGAQLCINGISGITGGGRTHHGSHVLRVGVG
jgi:hypothetical protein